MAVSIGKPTSNTNPLPRVDDVRSHRRRVRRFSFSGNYASGGYVVNAGDPGLGMKRIIGVNVLGGSLARAADGVTGDIVVIDYNAARTAFTIRLLESEATAAGTAVGQEKTNGEAHIANQYVDLEVIGY